MRHDRPSERKRKKIMAMPPPKKRRKENDNTEAKRPGMMNQKPKRCLLNTDRSDNFCMKSVVAGSDEDIHQNVNNSQNDDNSTTGKTTPVREKKRNADGFLNFFAKAFTSEMENNFMTIDMTKETATESTKSTNELHKIEKGGTLQIPVTKGKSEKSLQFTTMSNDSEKKIDNRSVVESKGMEGNHKTETDTGGTVHLLPTNRNFFSNFNQKKTQNYTNKKVGVKHKGHTNIKKPYVSPVKVTPSAMSFKQYISTTKVKKVEESKNEESSTPPPVRASRSWSGVGSSISSAAASTFNGLLSKFLDNKQKADSKTKQISNSVYDKSFLKVKPKSMKSMPPKPVSSFGYMVGKRQTENEEKSAMKDEKSSTPSSIQQNCLIKKSENDEHSIELSNTDENQLDKKMNLETRAKSRDHDKFGSITNILKETTSSPGHSPSKIQQASNNQEQSSVAEELNGLLSKYRNDRKQRRCTKLKSKQKHYLTGGFKANLKPRAKYPTGKPCQFIRSLNGGLRRAMVADTAGDGVANKGDILKDINTYSSVIDVSQVETRDCVTHIDTNKSGVDNSNPSGCSVIGKEDAGKENVGQKTDFDLPGDINMSSSVIGVSKIETNHCVTHIDTNESGVGNSNPSGCSVIGKGDIGKENVGQKTDYDLPGDINMPSSVMDVSKIETRDCVTHIDTNESGVDNSNPSGCSVIGKEDAGKGNVGQKSDFGMLNVDDAFIQLTHNEKHEYNDLTGEPYLNKLSVNCANEINEGYKDNTSRSKSSLQLNDKENKQKDLKLNKNKYDFLKSLSSEQHAINSTETMREIETTDLLKVNDLSEMKDASTPVYLNGDQSDLTFGIEYLSENHELCPIKEEKQIFANIPVDQKLNGLIGKYIDVQQKNKKVLAEAENKRYKHTYVKWSQVTRKVIKPLNSQKGKSNGYMKFLSCKRYDTSDDNKRTVSYSSDAANEEDKQVTNSDSCSPDTAFQSSQIIDKADNDQWQDIRDVLSPSSVEKTRPDNESVGNNLNGLISKYIEIQQTNKTTQDNMGNKRIKTTNLQLPNMSTGVKRVPKIVNNRKDKRIGYMKFLSCRQQDHFDTKGSEMTKMIDTSGGGETLVSNVVGSAIKNQIPDMIGDIDSDEWQDIGRTFFPSVVENQDSNEISADPKKNGLITKYITERIKTKNAKTGKLSCKLNVNKRPHNAVLKAERCKVSGFLKSLSGEQHHMTMPQNIQEPERIHLSHSPEKSYLEDRNSSIVENGQEELSADDDLNGVIARYIDVQQKNKNILMEIRNKGNKRVYVQYPNLSKGIGKVAKTLSNGNCKKASYMNFLSGRHYNTPEKESNNISRIQGEWNEEDTLITPVADQCQNVVKVLSPSVAVVEETRPDKISLDNKLNGLITKYLDVQKKNKTTSMDSKNKKSKHTGVEHSMLSRFTYRVPKILRNKKGKIAGYKNFLSCRQYQAHDTEVSKFLQSIDTSGGGESVVTNMVSSTAVKPVPDIIEDVDREQWRDNENVIFSSIAKDEESNVTSADRKKNGLITKYINERKKRQGTENGKPSSKSGTKKEPQKVSNPKKKNNAYGFLKSLSGEQHNMTVPEDVSELKSVNLSIDEEKSTLVNCNSSTTENRLDDFSVDPHLNGLIAKYSDIKQKNKKIRMELKEKRYNHADYKYRNASRGMGSMKKTLHNGDSKRNSYMSFLSGRQLDVQDNELNTISSSLNASDDGGDSLITSVFCCPSETVFLSNHFANEVGIDGWEDEDIGGLVPPAIVMGHRGNRCSETYLTVQKAKCINAQQNGRIIQSRRLQKKQCNKNTGYKRFLLSRKPGSHDRKKRTSLRIINAASGEKTMVNNAMSSTKQKPIQNPFVIKDLDGNNQWEDIGKVPSPSIVGDREPNEITIVPKLNGLLTKYNTERMKNRSAKHVKPPSKLSAYKGPQNMLKAKENKISGFLKSLSGGHYDMTERFHLSDHTEKSSRVNSSTSIVKNVQDDVSADSSLNGLIAKFLDAQEDNNKKVLMEIGNKTNTRASNQYLNLSRGIGRVPKTLNNRKGKRKSYIKFLSCRQYGAHDTKHFRTVQSRDASCAGATVISDIGCSGIAKLVPSPHIVKDADVNQWVDVEEVVSASVDQQVKGLITKYINERMKGKENVKQPSKLITKQKPQNLSKAKKNKLSGFLKSLSKEQRSMSMAENVSNHEALDLPDATEISSLVNRNSSNMQKRLSSDNKSSKIDQTAREDRFISLGEGKYEVNTGFENQKLNGLLTKYMNDDKMKRKLAEESKGRKFDFKMTNKRIALKGDSKTLKSNQGKSSGYLRCLTARQEEILDICKDNESVFNIKRDKMPPVEHHILIDDRSNVKRNKKPDIKDKILNFLGADLNLNDAGDQSELYNWDAIHTGPMYISGNSSGVEQQVKYPECKMDEERKDHIHTAHTVDYPKMTKANQGGPNEIGFFQSLWSKYFDGQRNSSQHEHEVEEQDDNVLQGHMLSNYMKVTHRKNATRPRYITHRNLSSSRKKYRRSSDGRFLKSLQAVKCETSKRFDSDNLNQTKRSYKYSDIKTEVEKKPIHKDKLEMIKPTVVENDLKRGNVPDRMFNHRVSKSRRTSRVRKIRSNTKITPIQSVKSETSVKMDVESSNARSPKSRMIVGQATPAQKHIRGKSPRPVSPENKAPYQFLHTSPKTAIASQRKPRRSSDNTLSPYRFIKSETPPQGETDSTERPDQHRDKFPKSKTSPSIDKFMTSASDRNTFHGYVKTIAEGIVKEDDSHQIVSPSRDQMRELIRLRQSQKMERSSSWVSKKQSTTYLDDNISYEEKERESEMPNSFENTYASKAPTGRIDSTKQGNEKSFPWVTIDKYSTTSDNDDSFDVKNYTHRSANDAHKETYSEQSSWPYGQTNSPNIYCDSPSSEHETTNTYDFQDLHLFNGNERYNWQRIKGDARATAESNDTANKNAPSTNEANKSSLGNLKESVWNYLLTWKKKNAEYNFPKMKHIDVVTSSAAALQIYGENRSERRIPSRSPSPSPAGVQSGQGRHDTLLNNEGSTQLHVPASTESQNGSVLETAKESVYSPQKRPSRGLDTEAEVIVPTTSHGQVPTTAIPPPNINQIAFEQQIERLESGTIRSTEQQQRTPGLSYEDVQAASTSGIKEPKTKTDLSDCAFLGRISLDEIHVDKLTMTPPTVQQQLMNQLEANHRTGSAMAMVHQTSSNTPAGVLKLGVAQTMGNVTPAAIQKVVSFPENPVIQDGQPRKVQSIEKSEHCDDRSPPRERPILSNHQLSSVTKALDAQRNKLLIHEHQNASLTSEANEYHISKSTEHKQQTVVEAVKNCIHLSKEEQCSPNQYTQTISPVKCIQNNTLVQAIRDDTVMPSTKPSDKKLTPSVTKISQENKGAKESKTEREIPSFSGGDATLFSSDYHSVANKTYSVKQNLHNNDLKQIRDELNINIDVERRSDLFDYKSSNAMYNLVETHWNDWKKRTPHILFSKSDNTIEPYKLCDQNVKTTIERPIEIPYVFTFSSNDGQYPYKLMQQTNHDSYSGPAYSLSERVSEVSSATPKRSDTVVTKTASVLTNKREAWDTSSNESSLYSIKPSVKSLKPITYRQKKREHQHRETNGQHISPYPWVKAYQAKTIGRKFRSAENMKSQNLTYNNISKKLRKPIPRCSERKPKSVERGTNMTSNKNISSQTTAQLLMPAPAIKKKKKKTPHASIFQSQIHEALRLEQFIEDNMEKDYLTERLIHMPRL